MSSPSTDPSSPFIAPLHGLRGIAALSVLVAHSRDQLGIPFVGNAGSIGVMLFFVLSGFLMAYLYLDRRPSLQAILDYTRNRLARIYPLFAVVVLIFGAVYVWVDRSFPVKMSVEAIGQHLLFYGSGRTLWTISVEFQFYAIFVLIWLAYSVSGPFRRQILVAASLVVIAILWATGFNSDRIAINGYLHVFLAGIIVWYLSTTRIVPILNRYADLLFVPLFLGFCLSLYFVTAEYGGRESYNLLWLVAGLGLMVLTAIAAPDSHSGRFLSSRPMRWLGELSFGIYLLHRGVMWLSDQLLPETPGLVQFAFIVAVSIALAQLAHIAIEKPARAAIKSIGRRTTSPSAY